ncbi:MAG: mevalonate kinase [Promethearchaeota archaeon]
MQVKKVHSSLVETSAPGKVILLGEHAVVYGAPAIAGAISLRSTCAVARDRPGEGDLVLELADYNERLRLDPLIEERGEYESFKGVVQFLRTMQEQFELDFAGVTVSLQSELPRAMGLGSSASILTALAGGLDEFFHLGLDTAEINELVLQGETVYHASPSGIDNTLCVHGGMLYYERGEIYPLPVPDGVQLLVVKSGVPRRTSKMVERVRVFKGREPAAFSGILTSIVRLVEKAKTSIENDDVESLGRAMYDNHRLLKRWGVSHPRLDQIVEVCREGGALGAKLTGGGGGGCAIALCDEPARVNIQNALERLGIANFLVTIDHEGLLGGPVRNVG